jgi:nicotinate phosphoribosyltransferase
VRECGKETWPGTKQILRERDACGILRGDSIALAAEIRPGEPLLREILRQGRRVARLPALTEIRAFCRQQVAALPAALRGLTAAYAPYPVEVSDGVRTLANRLDQSGE